MNRILIFSLSYTPFEGGAELAIKHITDRLDPATWEFDMITLRYDRALPRYERVGRVHVHRIGFTKRAPSAKDMVRFPLYAAKVLYPFLAFLKARSLHRTRRYRAVWAMMAYMGFPTLFFKVFHPNVPMILTLQEGDTIEHMTKRMRIRLVLPLYRAVFRKAAVVQAISNYLAGFARTMGARGPVVVVPNGVAIETFRYVEPNETVQKTLATYGLRPDDKVVITTSRLVEKNGIDTLISAMPFLPAQVKLVILGNGPLEQKLRKYAHERGLQTRIFFLGHVDSTVVPVYLTQADVFVRPSRSEGLGISFLEAMAAGVPVVATRVGGIPDFLVDGKTGLFCEVDKPESVAVQIEKLLNDIPLRERIIENGKHLIEERYQWDAIAARMEHEVLQPVVK